MRAAAHLLRRNCSHQACGVSQRYLLGQTRSRLRRSERTRAGSRAGACGTRRQSHGARVYRRWRRRVRRFSDGGDASPRIREHPDVTIDRRRPHAARCVHRGGRAMRASRQQADARGDCTRASPTSSRARDLPNVRVVVALGKIAFDVWWRVMRERAHRQTAPGIRPRRGLQIPGRRRDRVLPSEPAEHQHRQARRQIRIEVPSRRSRSKRSAAAIGTTLRPAKPATSP